MKWMGGWTYAALRATPVSLVLAIWDAIAEANAPAADDGMEG